MEENEVLENDVPETSEENFEEEVVNASQDETNQDDGLEVKKDDDDIEKRIEEEVNKRVEEKIESRLIRDRNSRERKQEQELAKYKQLENVIKAGLGVETLDDAISQTSNFYKEQGINIPEYTPSYSKRDEEILAEADARAIIELGQTEMESEANRIASIPQEKRTTREKVTFDALCKELMARKDIEELKQKGYKTDILDTKEFKDFRNQFSVNTSIATIYDMYNKINGEKVVQPKSPGSAKTNTSNNEIKEYYTPEEARQFTEEDLNNPKLMEAIEKSMLQWNKSN